MLTEVCDFVHNHFVWATTRGTYTITNGGIDLTGLVAYGQRFRIVGSRMNDGIYTYEQDGVYNDDDDEHANLLDETFDGAIVAMAVPTTFMSIVNDIKDWQTKNAATVESPYTSESFGGYSYTKAAGSSASSGGMLTWRDMFKSRLNAYRKIA